MSVNIGDLKYQNDVGGLGDKLKNLGGFWEYFNYVEGYKNKATISDLKLESDHTKSLSCADTVSDIDELDGTFGGHEIPVRDRQIKVRLCRDTAKHTYLVNRLSKGANNEGEQTAFLEDVETILINDNKRFLSKEIALDLYNLANLDTNVEHVVLPSISDAASAYAAVNKMIDGLPTDQVELIYDNQDESDFAVFINPTVMSLLHKYYEENQTGKQSNLEYTKDSRGIVIRGIPVRAWRGLIGNGMIFTPLSNISIYVDKLSDFTGVKVVPRNEINSDIIVMNFNLGAGYNTHELISIGV